LERLDDGLAQRWVKQINFAEIGGIAAAVR
jgi:hypothetical protein